MSKKSTRAVFLFPALISLTMPISALAHSRLPPFVGFYANDCKQSSYKASEQTCTANFSIGRAALRTFEEAKNTDTSLSKATINYSKQESINLILDTSKITSRRNSQTVDDAFGGNWLPLNDVNLPFNFTCNFSNGRTEATGVITFEHPSFIDKASVKFAVRCVPLTEEEAQKQQSEDERKRLKAEQEAAELARRASPEYKASEAANQIRAAQAYINSAQSVISEEKEIGQVSGYVNKSRLHDAGAQIIFYRKMIKDQWNVYKANGGSAKSVDDLLRLAK